MKFAGAITTIDIDFLGVFDEHIERDYGNNLGARALYLNDYLSQTNLFVSNHMMKGTHDTQCLALYLDRGERLGILL